ncbi:hypothetical protein GCM10009424_18130 [Sphingomonas ursincola]
MPLPIAARPVTVPTSMSYRAMGLAACWLLTGLATRTAIAATDRLNTAERRAGKGMMDSR